MKLTEARRLTERVLKKRTDRNPSYVMDLDDDPGTLGREFVEFARLWRNEMNAEARKWGMPEPGSEDAKIDEKYRRMLDAFTIFGGKLLDIARAYPDRPDPEAAKWARLFQASFPRVGRLTEAVDIFELQEWFSKRDLAASSRGEQEQAARALSMGRYKLEKKYRRELIEMIRRENDSGIRVKNVDGSIPA